MAIPQEKKILLRQAPCFPIYTFSIIFNFCNDVMLGARKGFLTAPFVQW